MTRPPRRTLKIAAAAGTAAVRILNRYLPRTGANGRHRPTQPCPEIRIESAELSRRDRHELAAGLARLARLTDKHDDPAAAARHLWGDR
ncbi:hypothetical protein [Actinomadura sp. 3N508]|uniref:hypothetical protein n=1 Tax=Actinomadura sp. 3N508 TaxID=3375153 RepID=UPI0037986E8C